MIKIIIQINTNDYKKGEFHMKHVLVTLPVKESHKAKIEKALSGCSFTYTTINDATEEMIKDAEIILGNVPAGKIKASEKLELLQLNSAGADAYIKPGILSAKTILCNATGAYSKAVSEHTLAAGLMLQKKLHLYRDLQNKAEWVDEGPITSITDATVLVVGLGDIGLHFAKMCKALGAHVIGVKRRLSECPEEVDELYLTEQLDELLPRADFIASFLPGTKATYHIYTAERFKLMKKTAIFLNSGRGDAVESSVLYNALSEGDIYAAAIDVTEPEPLPSESPLWKLPNLLITPHISGKFHLAETFETIVDIACFNGAAYLNGTALKNVVDFETGYKK